MELSQEFLPQIQKTFTGGVMPVSPSLHPRSKQLIDLPLSQVAVCMNNTEPYVEQGGQYVYPDYEQWMSGTTTVSLLAPTALSTSQSLTLTAASSASKTTTTSQSSTATKAPSSSASASSSSSAGSSSSAQSSRSSAPVSAASDAQAASQSTSAPSSGSSKIGLSLSAAVLGMMGFILV